MRYVRRLRWRKPSGQSWQFDSWTLAPILMMGVIYVCSWQLVHRQMPHRFGAARLASFLARLAALDLAIVMLLRAPGLPWHRF